MRKPVIGLMLAVSFILLIACANLAGLMLVRVSRRVPEIATRLSLGATRWAVLRQLWAESLLLAFMGAAVGLAVARGILSALPGFVPDEMMPLGGLQIDVRVLAFTFAASLFTSLLFGALPALQIAGRSSIVYGDGKPWRGARIQPPAPVADQRAGRAHGGAGGGGRIAGPQPDLPGNPASGL